MARPDTDGGSTDIDELAEPSSVNAEIAGKLRRRAFQLAERVKELNCLYSLSKLADQRDLDLADFLQRTVELIPDAWRYPELAGARVTVDGERFQTDNFVETSYKQEATITAAGDTVGVLEVRYREQRPVCDEGPFLKEERRLINAIAQQLGETIERRRTEGQLLGYQEQLRSLTEELVRAEERERRRIASDLHDQIGQTLAAVKIRLTMLLDTESESDRDSGGLRAVRSLVDQAIADTRFLIFDLSPPILYEFGLVAAFAWLVEEARKRYELTVELEERGEDRTINVETRVMLFRVARELLANSAKHADADKVRLSVDWLAGEIRICVEDDGVGFDVSRARRQGVLEGAFGLFSIQERIEQFGGRFQIDSRIGQGTRTCLTVPLNGEVETPRRKS